MQRPDCIQHSIVDSTTVLQKLITPAVQYFLVTKRHATIRHDDITTRQFDVGPTATLTAHDDGPQCAKTLFTSVEAVQSEVSSSGTGNQTAHAHDSECEQYMQYMWISTVQVLQALYTAKLYLVTRDGHPGS